MEEGSRRILRRVATRSDAADEPRYEIFHDRLGKAILSWRAKRLKEQEREKSQRQEVEQKGLAEQTRAGLRELISEATHRLGVEGQAIWARMMFYVVSTDGRRFAQTAGDLAKLSQQPREAVETVLKSLMEAGILRLAYGSAESPEQARYEVAHDAVAGSLLEWHSQYVLDLARATGGGLLRGRRRFSRLRQLRQNYSLPAISPIASCATSCRKEKSSLSSAQAFP